VRELISPVPHAPFARNGARVPPVLAAAITAVTIRVADWWAPALEPTMWTVTKSQVCGTETVGVFVL
jgi:hypothetical protein